MSYIPPNIVAKAKQMDLLTYLKTFEPYELVHVSGNEYSTKSHDSLKISNGMWMWWSRGIGGKSALDYLIKVQEIPFLDAVKMIIGQAAEMPSVSSCYEKKEKIDSSKGLELPKRNSNSNRVIQYLEERGISSKIILDCIKRGEIYESADYHNVVFVGFDDNKQPKYAAYRSCNDRRIMGEARGSDKRYAFHVKSKESTELHIFESAIDLLSYVTLLNMTVEEFRASNMISLGGVYVSNQNQEEMKKPKALERFLEQSTSINTIYLHLDNDEVGRLATKMITKQFGNKIKILDEPPLKDKDMNAYLMRLKSNIKRERKVNDER